jgi:hypothetical protein
LSGLVFDGLALIFFLRTYSGYSANWKRYVGISLQVSGVSLMNF